MKLTKAQNDEILRLAIEIAEKSVDNSNGEASAKDLVGSINSLRRYLVALTATPMSDRQAEIVCKNLAKLKLRHD